MGPPDAHIGASAPVTAAAAAATGADVLEAADKLPVGGGTPDAGLDGARDLGCGALVRVGACDGGVSAPVAAIAAAIATDVDAVLGPPWLSSSFRVAMFFKYWMLARLSVCSCRSRALSSSPAPVAPAPTSTTWPLPPGGSVASPAATFPPPVKKIICPRLFRCVARVARFTVGAAGAAAVSAVPLAVPLAAGAAGVGPCPGAISAASSAWPLPFLPSEPDALALKGWNKAPTRCSNVARCSLLAGWVRHRSRAPWDPLGGEEGRGGGGGRRG